MTLEQIATMPRGTRLHHDKVRGTMVLLAPEKALMLDDIGTAILTELDGTSTIAQIAQRLAQAYQAPQEQVLADVTGFLDGLRAQCLIDYADA